MKKYFFLIQFRMNTKNPIREFPSKYWKTGEKNMAKHRLTYIPVGSIFTQNGNEWSYSLHNPLGKNKRLVIRCIEHYDKNDQLIEKTEIKSKLPKATRCKGKTRHGKKCKRKSFEEMCCVHKVITPCEYIM